MKKLTTNILTAVACVMVLTTLGLWAAPQLIAAVKAALVQNIDEPGRNAFQQGGFSFCPGAKTCDVLFTAVPAGKRLVITNISGLMVSFSGPGRHLAILNRGHNAQVFLPTVYQGTLGGADTYDFDRTVLTYYEAGESPVITLIADSTFSNDFPNTQEECTIFGYYINLP